ncbi:unnamed protein product, partial [Rotaria sp. Silwood2]
MVYLKMKKAVLQATRKISQKDLLDIIYKLEQLKLNAKTSQEIIEILENSQQNLEHLQSE